MSRRIEDLEVKVAFLEHHLDQLDELVRTVIGRLDQLQREVEEIRMENQVASVQGSLQDEVPPHHLPKP